MATARRSAFLLPRLLIWPVLELWRRALLSLMHLRGTHDQARRFVRDSWKQGAAGRHRSAILYAQYAVACDPRYPDAHRMLGLAYLRDGQPNKAKAAYERGLRVAPGNVHLLTYLGDLEAQQRRFAEAEELFRRALGLAADDLDQPKLLAKLAATVGRRGRLAEAFAMAEQARQRWPDSADILTMLGDLYLLRGDGRLAVDQFRAALAHDAPVARTHYGLAYALANMERRDEALTAARRAVELDPTDRGFQELLQAIELRVGPHH